MKKLNLFIGFVLFCALTISCTSHPDIAEIEKEIIQLHQDELDAHINKDVSFFTKDLADNYMHVQYGDINYPHKDSLMKKFDDYLNSTTFTRYEDLQKPIVKVSKDGSLAWSIVQVKIEGERKLENDSIYDLNFTCAWISLYEKMDDKWIKLGIVDNFKVH
jgi:hypothetical protein